jgi:hypothetical protein
MARRSQEEIVDHIVGVLGGLKPKATRVHETISVQIASIKSARARTPAYLFRTSEIRQKAAAAAKAVDEFADVLPMLGPFDFRQIAAFLSGLASKGGIRGPRRNSRPLDRLYAQHAWSIVEQFSKSPPGSTERGKVLPVAQLLFEAVTGKQSTDTALLRAVEDVSRSRKENLR